MAAASFAVPHFLGGELSKFAQGRFDKPDYRNSLRVCINAFPAEIGPWTRRPGTMFAGTTLNGMPGRVIRFDFESAAPITCEYTDANLRFRAGTALVSGTLATPFTNGSWAAIRPVQAETTQILLSPTVVPQALVATVSPGVPATFALGPVTFNDGPYLDPFTNGVLATPGGKTGVVSLTLSFAPWNAATAYAKGSFTTFNSVNYISLIDQNIGNEPDALPGWAPTSPSVAINGGKGFLSTDIGRLVRLLSEPQQWLIGSTYATGAVVAFNPTGVPGASVYYQSLVSSNIGNTPGTDLTHWQIIASGVAIWTWGKIVSLSNIIDPALSGSSSIGNMNLAGGNDAAFNSDFTQGAGTSAVSTIAASGTQSLYPPQSQIVNTTYVGKNYAGASNQKIDHATVYPSSDLGFASGQVTTNFGTEPIGLITIIFNLRGKASAPLNSADGTLLGANGVGSDIGAAATITSSDTTTAWAYVWVEMVTTFTVGGNVPGTGYSLSSIIGQISFVAPAGTGTSSGAEVELLGGPLLYTAPIQTWRLGVYTAGVQPTCGVYNDGRLYLGGAVGNRFDACYSNGISGNAINFAPTDQYGQVTAAHAISYTFDSDGVNPIFGMAPDLQGVLMFTQAGEWLVQAPTAGPISPLNITARNVTHHGSANVQPVRTEHTIIFVQRFARKLLEYFPDVFSGKFSAPNLADKTIRTKPGVAELAYTSAVNPILWVRMSDGTWASVTYKRDSLASSQPPTFYAWAGQQLGSGRVVESICAGPSVGGDLDALTMVTNDPATNIRHVEILTDVQDEETALADSWFLDDAVTAAVSFQIDTVTLSAIQHIGKTVQVFASGLDLGDPGEGKPFADFVVSEEGLIVIPYGDGISAGPGRGLFTSAFAKTATFVVGFTYNSDGQMIRPVMPADSGSRTGPALGHVIRQNAYYLQMVNTLGLLLGRDFNHLNSANLKENPAVPLPPLETYTGIAWDSASDDYGRNNSLCWRISRPFPATITAINNSIESAET